MSKQSKNRFPRLKGRGSLIFLPAGRQVAQDSLHLRHEYRSFFARNKDSTAALTEYLSYCIVYVT